MPRVQFVAGELAFEWDAAKAAANRRKHGISFEEAATVLLDAHARVFDDPTAADPSHGFWSWVSRRRDARSSSCTSSEESIFASSARERRHGMSVAAWRKGESMRKEYTLGAGRPNPYARRLGAAGRTVLLERFLRAEHFVRLDDDVAEAFEDEAAVNEALRLVLRAKALATRVSATPRRRRGRKLA